MAVHFRKCGRNRLRHNICVLVARNVWCTIKTIAQSITPEHRKAVIENAEEQWQIITGIPLFLVVAKVNYGFH